MGWFASLSNAFSRPAECKRYLPQTQAAGNGAVQHGPYAVPRTELFSGRQDRTLSFFHDGWLMAIMVQWILLT